MSAKVAVITGVLGGIGNELAKKFREEGYFVYGLDVRNSATHEANELIVFDLNQFSKGEHYFQEWSKLFTEKLHRVDVLINNAAVQLLGGIQNIKLGDWEETLRVNVTGPLLLSQLLLNQLEKSQGCIINIGSIHHQLTKPNFISYATSKSALIGLTKALAVDLQGRIRVNAISPAAIETAMLRAGFDNDENALDELRKIHPVQRIGYPSDVAKMALFLASDKSGFIHGANLTLDGGISSVLKDL
ncbi:NAD-dependent glycerol dehydrogenase [Emticicia aquatica]|uniref:NAD-dependent glycerol dehydrogenase n=1 Tax=Emticicia aquatica TaxID=1681835 RepID=A0ABN8EYB1_9BACT|nr:SDR family oxidoreductase [Emticicia aquatica]CAH0996740.1 NAD-dependent glycerol dehydrogenase [Emticicia aquatica]